jgi:hypothetical protein
MPTTRSGVFLIATPSTLAIYPPLSLNLVSMDHAPAMTSTK